jgi:hypothetical protein
VSTERAFVSTVKLPDVPDPQVREHMDVGEMRAYLYSCVRMGADINSFKVTFDGKDITAAFRRELMRLVL